MVRRNKYRFRILHIYAVKPITWQPSTTQTDGERQWAERVLCLIGGPRETVYSDCSDEHFKKTEGQIGQTQAFSPKRPRARTRRAFHGRDAGLHREGNSRRRLCAHRYSICLLLPLAIRPKIICRTQFVHLHISEPTPGPSGTQRQTTPGTPGPRKRSSGAAAAGR